MGIRHHGVLSLAAAGAFCLTGCASSAASVAPHAATPDSPSELVVLLPDPGVGSVGHAVVTTKQGQVSLVDARSATRTGRGLAPTPPSALSERDVERLFGALIDGLPPASRSFTLFFKFESEELTDESRALVSAVVAEVMHRPVPDVVAVGHTDTTGQPSVNARLGLKRATAVRDLLVTAGLPPAAVTVASHGEAELLVRTADGVFEPRNRRVEITVQ